MTRQTKCPNCGHSTLGLTAPTVNRARRPLLTMNERTEHGVAVPLEQALVSGGFVAGLGAIAMSLLPGAGAEWIKFGAFAGLLTGGLVWRWAIQEDGRRVWHRIEAALGVDLDGDGVIGDPGPGQPSERLLPVHNAGRPLGARTRFEQFVKGCELRTAQNYWEQERKLDRGDYTGWRDTLISLGWAAWRSKHTPKQGWKLLFPPDEIIAGMFRGGTAKTSRPTVTGAA